MATTAKSTKTTTRRKSTPAGKTKSAARKSAAAKPDPTAPTELTGVTAAPEADLSEAEAPKPKVAPAGMFKMQELMAALEGKSELKRAELRQTAGLVLEALGTALHEGHDVALPGLGKITAKRREAKPNGDQIVARIKLNATAPGPIRTPGVDDE